MSTIKVRTLDISKEKDAIKTSGSKRQVEISVFFLNESFCISGIKTFKKSNFL